MKKQAKRNGTSERGGVSAVSGERLRNPSRSRTEVRSPTSTSTRTEVRSPTSTSTSTRARTQGNVTVTGGAGRGNTTVTIRRNPGRKKFWILVSRGGTSNVVAKAALPEIKHMMKIESYRSKYCGYIGPFSSLSQARSIRLG